MLPVPLKKERNVLILKIESKGMLQKCCCLYQKGQTENYKYPVYLQPGNDQNIKVYWNGCSILCTDIAKELSDSKIL